MRRRRGNGRDQQHDACRDQQQRGFGNTPATHGCIISATRAPLYAGARVRQMAALSNQRCSAGPRVFAGTCGFSPMSRLRRLELHSRLFFVTCNLRSDVRPFSNREYHNLAESFAATRTKVHFEFCGYCFLPDHWHATLLPDTCTSISEILMRVKISAYQRMRKESRSHGLMWQCRF